MSAAVTEDLLVVGAGGFARETAQAVRDVAAADAASGRAPRWRLAGHLDDDPALHGREVDGVPVPGGCELVHALPAARVVVCVGSPRDYAVRARLVRRLGLPVERYATVVHPTAAVSGSSSVGPGSVLLAHSVLTAGVRVGSHVAVMPQVVLTHEDEVGDFATLASGVRLGGGVRVGRGAYVGAGALVREYAAIGAWSLTGMGSTVLADVPAGEVWAGSPARLLRPAGATALAELAREAGEPGGAGCGPDGDAPAPDGDAPAHGTKDGTGPNGRRPETRMESPVV
ncbi:NeuD/PglB/VioB family sugar acetyltransferase [Streptomyces sp. PCS3-D2]|uniref:NeuD/PglB/VioB family sugar acetyltransferase n=1 Tax=Streptomyces sp. PCS3-D2 TaxID=1460244 RepID=UPI0009974519|nr:NeuD/PglB/VioB family sugar acetyltransferase [Streptomyces sp. PCS3-D2]WKV71142.1 NeuD/PglB/VioB family sugar acetyltransferase [Streptomyces sp. PCS3-D2]